jgi:hypothetical protein
MSVCWFRQCLFDCPTSNKATAKTIKRQSEFLGPIEQNLRLSTKFDISVVGPIPVLNVPCRPAAITRFIVAVVIDSIDLVPWRWPWPHVGEKQGEVIPSITNLNSSTSIPAKVGNVRVAASVSHIPPYRILT